MISSPILKVFGVQRQARLLSKTSFDLPELARRIQRQKQQQAGHAIKTTDINLVIHPSMTNSEVVL